MAYEIWETCMLVPGFSRSECASWVQAWGSVAAILAAVAVANYQTVQTRRQDAKNYARKIDALNGIFDQAVELISDIVWNCRTPVNIYWYLTEEYPLPAVDDTLKEMSSISIEGLGSAQAVKAMLKLRGNLLDAKRLAGSLSEFDDEDYDRTDWEDYCNYADRLLASAVASRKHISEAVGLVHR
jgi:hypothetical protein